MVCDLLKSSVRLLPTSAVQLCASECGGIAWRSHTEVPLLHSRAGRLAKVDVQEEASVEVQIRAVWHDSSFRMMNSDHGDCRVLDGSSELDLSGDFVVLGMVGSSSDLPSVVAIFLAPHS